MSKKETVTETPEQEKKVVTRYDRRIQRRKEQEEKLKKEHKITMAISIAILVAVVALIASFPIRTFIAVNQEFVEIGGEKVTKLEFDYNYYSAINTYYNMYGAYLSYMGLDLSSDLSQQMYSNTLTWQDYFQESAANNIKTNKSLLKEANAEGFTYDVTEEYNTFRESMQAQASSSGVSTDNYVKSVYGSNATMKRIEKFVKEGILVSAFYEHKQEEKTPGEDEITAYYEEHPDDYDSVDYRVTQIEAELPTEPTELADPQPEETEEGEDAAEGEDAQEEAYQPSEAEIAAAMDVAREKAEAAEKTIETDVEITENTTRENLNYNYSSWLFEAERTEGETTIIEDSVYHSYYVVQFVKRYRNDDPTVTFRRIYTTDVAGSTIIDEWNNNGATEDAFIDLVDKYSLDTSVEHGLYEGVAESNISEEMSAWLYEEGRKPGDTTVIDSEDGTYHNILYYVGEDKPSWYHEIEHSLLDEAMHTYLEEISADCEIVDKKGNLNYIAVESSEAAASAAAAAAAQESTEGSDATEQTEAGE